MKFRNLYPTEIQIRPTDTKYKGSCTLLLFQDARCAMDILDESVGEERWQAEYYEVKGNAYCRIGIYTDNGWVWKSDCGIESNIDAQKGEASDAFKRAAVRWGIGRELYSGPRIKINCPDDYYFNDKMTMSFYVQSISYDNKKITAITIADRFNNIVFDWDVNRQNKPISAPQNPEWTPTPQQSYNPANEPEMEPQKENPVYLGLKEFCRQAKPYEDHNELKKFFNFWAKKTGNWRGNMNYQKLWENWKQNIRPERAYA